MENNGMICSVVIFCTIVVTALLTLLITAKTINTLGEDGYLKPKLIEEQCGHYDQLTGEYIIKNILKEQ